MSPAEQADWLDVDIELFLLQGAGAGLSEVRPRDLLAAMGVTYVVGQGFNPRRVALMSLYRLGWTRKLIPGNRGDHGGLVYVRPAGAALRAPFASFAAALDARVEASLSERWHSAYTTPRDRLWAIDASHLDFRSTRELVRGTLERMGFVRDHLGCYRRPALHHATLTPCGSSSSTHHDAGAQPEKPAKTTSRIQRTRGTAEKGTLVEASPM